MDVIFKEGPLFLQGVKFGKVRFIENDHLTLQGGNNVALILLMIILILFLVLLLFCIH